MKRVDCSIDKAHNYGKPAFAGRPEEMLLLGSGIVTAITTLYLLVVKYSVFRQLNSACNRRLLGAVQAWLDHGFWRLGGFMYFEDSYTGTFPNTLYRSQSSYYILPHYFATLVGGEPGFWFVTGLVPILMAVVISTSLACIAWLTVESIAKCQKWAGIRGSQLVAAVATFSVSFSSEPIWSLTWDTFDGSWSVVFYVLALAIALLYRRLNLSRGGDGCLVCYL